MIAVIFEARVSEDGRDTYLALAAALLEELERIEGFISVERFQSLSNPGKLLSLSFWADEAAVARWRNHERHRQAQAEGRASVFATYRLRVAEVVRDYGARERREQAPGDSRAFHERGSH